MHKSDIVKALALKTGLTKKDSEATLNGLLEIMTKGLKKGEDIVFIGFGSLKKVRSEARKGRNPRTGKEIKIKARNRIKFSAGKALKDAVN
ncbi:HU family DNA-binding protein [Pseudomonadota bacterium]